MTAFKITTHAFFGLYTIGIIWAICSFLKWRFKDIKNIDANPERFIRWGEAYGYIGYGVYALMYFVSIMILFDPFKITSPDMTIEDILFSAMCAILFANTLCVYVMLLANWNIEMKEDCFIHTNMLGFKKTYRYDEIEIKQLSAVYRCYKDGKWKITISHLAINNQALITAQKKYLNLKK